MQRLVDDVDGPRRSTTKQERRERRSFVPTRYVRSFETLHMYLELKCASLEYIADKELQNISLKERLIKTIRSGGCLHGDCEKE